MLFMHIDTDSIERFQPTHWLLRVQLTATASGIAQDHDRQRHQTAAAGVSSKRSGSRSRARNSSPSISCFKSEKESSSRARCRRFSGRSGNSGRSTRSSYPDLAGSADLVVAMIVERLIHPASKLATARLLNTTSLAGELTSAIRRPTELYDALDWLERIAPSGSRRNWRRGTCRKARPPLFDVSSTSYEGRHLPPRLLRIQIVTARRT